MKKRFLIASIIIAMLVGWFLFAKTCIYTPSNKGEKIIQLQKEELLQDGDIIFQESQSAQCKAVQKATNSRYSHCGIIFRKDDKYFVYEAIEPVVITQLNHWIDRGKNRHYIVKRLKNADTILTPETKEKMLVEAKKHLEKHYDLTFSWTDDKIYCSELIWKIYKRGANIEVGKLETLADFNLSHPLVKKKLKERYGENIPLDEIVISPVSILKSNNLETITEN